MGSTPMVTLENAPRDEAGLMEVGRAQRYRLCLTIDLWGGDENKENAFLGMSNEEQTATVLAGLIAHDSGNGISAPAAPALAVVPDPAPSEPAAPEAMSAPAAMTAPEPKPEPIRTPSTQSDPENAGDARVEPAPEGAKLMLQGLHKMGESVQYILSAVKEISGGHEELYDAVETIRNAMVFNTELALLVAVEALKLDRKHVIKMVQAELQGGGTQSLFEETEVDEGKGG